MSLPQKLKLRTMAPVFIGSGNEVTAIEYFQKDGNVYFLDFDEFTKIYVQITGRNFKEAADYLTQFISKNMENNQLKNKDQIFTDELCNKIIEKGAYTYVADASSADLVKYKRNIKTHIKTGKKAYIPGSSIKGAIRTAYIYKILKKDSSKYEKFREQFMKFLEELNGLSEKINKEKDRKQKNKLAKRKEEVIQTLNDEIQMIVFENRTQNNKMDIQKDPFRNVIVRDTEPTRKISIENYHRYHKLSEKRANPIVYETIAREVSLETSLICKENQEGITSEFLLNCIEEFYKDLCVYFNKEALDGYYLFIGGGTSLITKTVYLLLDNFEDEKILQRYRNIVTPKSNINLKRIKFNKRNEKGIFGELNGKMVVPDKHSDQPVELNETWFCIVKHFKKNLVFANPIIKEGEFTIPFPLTEVINESGEGLGCVKLELAK